MQKVLFLLCVISSCILLGCGDSATPQAEAPSDDELTQFLADNPDMVTDDDEESDDDEE